MGEKSQNGLREGLKSQIQELGRQTRKKKKG